MRICIIGAGAIGGLLAVKLAGAGEAVSVIDRGAHLAAIRVNGLQLHWDDGSVLKAKVNACETAAEAGKQELVVLAVKAYDLEAATKDIENLLGPETMVMTVQNGIPWWYFETAGGSFEGIRLQSLDPAGILSDTIEADRIIGCVSYPAASLSAPGVIHHVEGIRFPLGELDGRETERAKLVSETLIDRKSTRLNSSH